MPLDQDKQHSAGPISRSHPTGADYRLYVTDGTEPSAPFEQSVRAASEQELDASSIMLTSEDSLVPLYDWNERYSKIASYGKGMVSGQIEINFSEKWLRTWRSERLQGLWGKTLWMVSSFIDWMEPAIVRETTKVGPIYPQPFRHDPEEAGHATETITFSARRAAMVGVQKARVSQSGIGEFVEAAEATGETVTRELIRREEEEFFARIYPGVNDDYDFGVTGPDAQTGSGHRRRTYVEDGDTFYVHVLARPGRSWATVRLLGVDTPEVIKYHLTEEGLPAWGDPSQQKNPLGTEGPAARNEGSRTSFQWPRSAPPVREGETYSELGETGLIYGRGGSSPTARQLLKWGLVAGEFVRRRLEGSGSFRLVRVPGSSNTGQFGRELFRVRTPQGEDLSLELIRAGLAAPNYTAGLTGLDSGDYEHYGYQLEEAYREARSNAGTEDARGIWSCFDPEAEEAETSGIDFSQLNWHGIQ